MAESDIAARVFLDLISDYTNRKIVINYVNVHNWLINDL